MNIWTDVCVNLTNKRFHKDYRAVIERAIEAGVTRMIITGTSAEHSLVATRLCEQYPQHLRCTVGCHPHDAKEMTEAKWQMLEQLVESPYAVAVGECGLDFNRLFSSEQQQIDILVRQLDLAARFDKPVFLHERDAQSQLLAILHQYHHSLPRKLLHCFTGDAEQLSHYLELDMYIGITGWVCDERRNEDLLAALPMIPFDRLLIETDAPYLTPRNLTDKPSNGRNEPQYLTAVAKAIAQQTNIDLPALAAVTTLNSVEFFSWPIDTNSIVEQARKTIPTTPDT